MGTRKNTTRCLELAILYNILVFLNPKKLCRCLSKVHINVTSKPSNHRDGSIC